MFNIFEVKDKTGRIIRLTQRTWSHIREEHPEIVFHEELEGVLTNPDKVILSDRDAKSHWFFKYDKKRKEYLKVPVKYLNGDGFVITAHHTSKIQ